MCLIISRELIPKIKGPEARDRKHAKTIHFFSQIHQVNVLAHLSYIVTYVTTFHKCPDIVVKERKGAAINTIKYNTQPRIPHGKVTEVQ